MNKYVKLVKKWLADPESVSLEELKANKEDAWAATWDIRDAASNAAYAAYAAYAAADDDAYGAAGWADYWADYWRSRAIKYVKEYEELNK